MSDSDRQPLYEYDLVSKVNFAYGEWMEEPDRVQWLRYGFPCLVARHVEGFLRGYAGIPKTHPLWGFPVEDVKRRIHAHHGITHAALAAGDVRCTLAAGVDNLAELWFIGFECNGEDDYSPDDILDGRKPSTARVYRPFVYVAEQVDRIVIQLRDLRATIPPTPARQRGQVS